MEHIVCFLHFMGAHAHDVDLCMRGFSKSLSDQAYILYVNFKPGLVHDKEHLVSLFNTKFFCVEANFTLAELGRMYQYPREDLDAYVKKFYENALDFCDLVADDVLVDVCLHDMIEEYIVYLENLSFSSFFQVNGGREVHK